MDKEKKVAPKTPRPNYQMWVILALVGVILAISWFTKTGELVEITESRFEDMVKAKDIKRLVQLKSDNIWIIEITLKADALKNARYKQELERTHNAPTPAVFWSEEFPNVAELVPSRSGECWPA